MRCRVKGRVSKHHGAPWGAERHDGRHHVVVGRSTVGCCSKCGFKRSRSPSLLYPCSHTLARPPHLLRPLPLTHFPPTPFPLPPPSRYTFQVYTPADLGAKTLPPLPPATASQHEELQVCVGGEERGEEEEGEGG